MRKAAVLLISVLMIFIFLAIMMTQSLMIVQRLATVTEVVPPVWVKSATDADFRPLYEDAMVRAGDLVKTSENGRLTLNWVDGSRIRLDPSTTLKVLKCSLNKSSNARTSLFHLDVGRVWIRILEALGERSKFQIRTPTVTAGVRGTVFSVEITADGDTQISVYEGSVALEAAGKLLKAGAGENAVIGRQSAPTKLTMSDEEAAAWDEQGGIVGPRLELKTPATAEVAPDAQKVTIEGVAEPNAEVTVNDRPVELDSDSRFQLHLPFDTNQSHLKLVITVRDRRGEETRQELVLSRTK